MNQEQLKSALRTLVSTGGGILAGLAIGKGWITQSQAQAILSNQPMIDLATEVLLLVFGAGGTAAVGIWGVVGHSAPNMVATVAAMPEVSKVETARTDAGVALAAAVPSVPGSVVTVAK